VAAGFSATSKRSPVRGFGPCLSASVPEPTGHGDSCTFRIAYPHEVARYLVFKGSVAIEGISLTIANLTDDYFEIAVIPKTLEVTNFSQLEPGDEVNLEVDVIAKYVERILSVRSTGS